MPKDEYAGLLARDKARRVLAAGRDFAGERLEAAANRILAQAEETKERKKKRRKRRRRSKS